MVKPIDGAASLTQAQNAQELLISAQREAALTQLRHNVDTKRAKEAEQTTVTQDEQATGKSIRDDDPRRRHNHRNPEDEPERDGEDSPPDAIDIVV